MSTFKAGVVVVTRFVDKEVEAEKQYKSKKLQTFQDYINYIDRAAAVRNENFQKYSMYNDYMGNPEKSAGLFTAEKDSLNEEERKALKQAFQTAYDNDSIMWQTVISFDNRFLTKQGLYDPATGKLDEKKLQDCARNMMRDALKREGLSESAVWSASIHYNTDNIHIHVAAVEPFTTRRTCNYKDKERPRGFFYRKTISGMKSSVVNTLLQSDRAYMDELVRRRMLQGKREQVSCDDYEMRRMFAGIYKKLPTDRRKWFYNWNDMEQIKPLIDSMSRYYINTYHKDDFAEFQRLILKEQETFREAYGENSHYKDYAQNKMKDLYARMGNVILAEMREYSKHEIKFGADQQDNFGMNAYRMNQAIKKIEQNLDAEFKQKRINQIEHERLNYDISQ